MLAELKSLGWNGLKDVEHMWASDFQNRKIISQFIKDGLLGKKRLMSLPDRITNTINTADGKTVYRPTTINCYDGQLTSLDDWFNKWIDFMFHTKIRVQSRKNDHEITLETVPANMLIPIKQSKYPAITKEEEAISLPLQVLSCLIFDAIQYFMLNKLAPDTWQPLRNELCEKLNRNKIKRSIEILEKSYSDSDVMFLQEVAGKFIDDAMKSKLSEDYYIKYPVRLNRDRDQNSIILLKKSSYFESVTEVTDEIVEQFRLIGSDVPVEDGDLFAILATATLRSSRGATGGPTGGARGTEKQNLTSEKTEYEKFLLVSFHGDTNGLATIPVLNAVLSYMSSHLTSHKLLFGMDANTYANPHADQQGVTDFAKHFTSKHLNSCYGPTPNPLNFTTFHARTHMQTQLNKAISLQEKDLKGDKNPKDFILFFDADFRVHSTTKDNTGHRKYIEDMVFPTLSFPSDHGITSTVLAKNEESSFRFR